MSTTASINAPRKIATLAESRRVRVPGATYRLQLTRDFTLRDAMGILDYLESLGVTDVYASPLFKAGPESTHGYDVCCHDQINGVLGGNAAFEEFTRELRRHGLGLLLDIVPNHMAAHHGNPYWWDVLKCGRSSRYAAYFDIDWERGGGKVVLPILGDELENVLARGEVILGTYEDQHALKYYEKALPISPETGAEIDSAAPDIAWILAAQHYKLVHWRQSSRQINYRRFFDINELVALRMEDTAVFADTHRLVVELIREGKVHGLRVDHPDGLRDPAQYFQRLMAATSDGDQYPYVVAEKILSHGEQLPRDWPVAGTTGYDFLNDVNSLFVARENEPFFTELFHEFTGCRDTFHDVAYRARKRVLEKSFAGDVDALAAQLTRATHTKHSVHSLRAALVEFIACFPVYRTYIREESLQPAESDVRVIDEAFTLAHQHTPSLHHELDLLKQVLLLKTRNDSHEVRSIVLRFQQLTGPAAAKGIEDTAFYRYNRLVSLNEVGGDPEQFGITVNEFHRRNIARAEHWPHTLLATATHDTKRGEDMRACINVLSELPSEWRDAVLRWRALNACHRTLLNGEPAPDANDEYFFYQTLIGAWDDTSNELEQRLAAYMLKAIKEAKRRTSWLDPHAEYESATRNFVERVLRDEAFREDFVLFQRRIAFFGRINSLAHTLLKFTAPGVPDIYQGSESWDFNLVDPDNRRLVDFDERRALLNDTRSDDTASKIHVVSRALRFRNSHRDLFACGAYQPLRADTEHICSFMRCREQEQCIVIVPRLVATLMRGCERPALGIDVWENHTVPLDYGTPASVYRNVMTDERVKCENGRIRLSEALASFPVALLEPEE